MEKIVGDKYNMHKLLISKWKSIFNIAATTTLTDFTNLMKNLEGKTSVFILIEGFSKTLNEHCILGVYNRNALFNKGGDYFVKTSEDNFCFCIQGKLQNTSFSLKPEHSVIRFDTNDKTKELNIAEGFIRIPFPNEKSFVQGAIQKGTQNHLEITDNYVELKDFKMEKLEVYALDEMQESTNIEAIGQNQDNVVKTVYNNLNTKFEGSHALRYYREN